MRNFRKWIGRDETSAYRRAKKHATELEPLVDCPGGQPQTNKVLMEVFRLGRSDLADVLVLAEEVNQVLTRTFPDYLSGRFYVVSIVKHLEKPDQ